MPRVQNTTIQKLLNGLGGCEPKTKILSFTKVAESAFATTTRFNEKYGKEVITDETIGSVMEDNTSTNYHKTRSKSGHVSFLEKKCFICNMVRDVDGNSYNYGCIIRIIKKVHG